MRQKNVWKIFQTDYVMSLGVFNTRDLFAKVDKTRIPIKCGTKQDFCKKVFDKMIELILLEVIEKNVIFALPKFYGLDAEFYIETVSGDELKECIQKGEFEDVDFIQSGFKAHRVRFSVEKKRGDIWEYCVWLKDKELIKKLTDNTNNGNVY